LGKNGSFDYKKKACQLVHKNMKRCVKVEWWKGLMQNWKWCYIHMFSCYNKKSKYNDLSMWCLNNKDCHGVVSTFSLGEMSRNLKQKLAMLGGEVQIYNQRS
jgi:hypothetical protein